MCELTWKMRIPVSSSHRASSHLLNISTGLTECRGIVGKKLGAKQETWARSTHTPPPRPAKGTEPFPSTKQQPAEGWEQSWRAEGMHGRHTQTSPGALRAATVLRLEVGWRARRNSSWVLQAFTDCKMDFPKGWRQQESRKHRFWGTWAFTNCTSLAFWRLGEGKRRKAEESLSLHQGHCPGQWSQGKRDLLRNGKLKGQTARKTPRQSRSW